MLYKLPCRRECLTLLLKMLFFNVYFFIIIILFLHSRLYPPPGLHPLTVPHSKPPSSASSPRECLHPPPPHQAPHSWGPQVSWKLGASSLTESRPCSPLLYASWLVAQCVRALCGSKLIDTAGLPIGVALLSFCQLFPNSTTRVLSFCPLIGHKYPNLTLSAAWCASWRAVMIGFCL